MLAFLHASHAPCQPLIDALLPAAGRLQVGEGFLLGNPDQVSFNPIQAEAAEAGVIRCDAAAQAASVSSAHIRCS